MHIAREVLMIRPAQIKYQEEGRASYPDFTSFPLDTYRKFLEECDMLADRLTSTGIEVTVFNDNSSTPFSFRNPIHQMISFHTTGEIIQYPISDPGQRPSLLSDIIQYYLDRDPRHTLVNLSEYEQVGVFLEGTESVLFDRKNRLAYAYESRHTHPGFFERFCQYFQWEPTVFQGQGDRGETLTHTYQLMTLGDGFALLCKELLSESTYNELRSRIEAGGRECIDISYAQMLHIAPDLIQLQNQQGESHLILSKKVLDSMEASLVNRLEGFANLFPVSLDCMDPLWGRGVRGVLTEIFTYQPENSLHETKDNQ